MARVRVLGEKRPIENTGREYPGRDVAPPFVRNGSALMPFKYMCQHDSP